MPSRDQQPVTRTHHWTSPAPTSITLAAQHLATHLEGAQVRGEVVERP